MTTSRILVADDDPHIREVIGFALQKAGMVVTAVRDGAEALDCLDRQSFDLAVLDIGMPEVDGLDVCRRLRRTSEVPILFLSAHDEEIDRVLGLEIGGDDYVTKPFSPRELVARIRAILKRSGSRAPASAGSLRQGGLSLDPESHLALFEAAPLTLTALEFAFLLVLMRRPRQVFSRDRILSSVYGAGTAVSDRTVDSHIRNIRAKLLAVGCAEVIDTVHGVGFRLGACTPGKATLDPAAPVP